MSCLKDLLHGNILLIICVAFYLLWWILAFMPHHKLPTLLTAPIICFAGAIGIVGGYIELKAMSSLTLSRSLIGGLPLIGIGVIVYLTLMLVSGFVLKRPITTELILIVGWCVLQINYLNVLYGLNHISYTLTLLMMLLIIVIGILSLAAYLYYYQLSDLKSYIDGMIPLILIGITMIATSFITI